MNNKQEYQKPETTCIELEVEGMIAASGDTYNLQEADNTTSYSNGSLSSSREGSWRDY